MNRQIKLTESRYAVKIYFDKALINCAARKVHYTNNPDKHNLLLMLFFNMDLRLPSFGSTISWRTTPHGTVLESRIV